MQFSAQQAALQLTAEKIAASALAAAKTDQLILTEASKGRVHPLAPIER